LTWLHRHRWLTPYVLLALVISYPLAYWIAFRGGRWKNLLLPAIIAPFVVAYLIRTLAWQNVLADEHGGRNLRDLHILEPDGRLLATSTAVVAGITYNFLPFMALPLYVALEQIDPRLIEAAQDLYASRVKAFLRVTLPLSLPGVFAWNSIAKVALLRLPRCGSAAARGRARRGAIADGPLRAGAARRSLRRIRARRTVRAVRDLDARRAVKSAPGGPPAGVAMATGVWAGA
jgi:ABC-type proline/glycine betaine transport system permease subunit